MEQKLSNLERAIPVGNWDRRRSEVLAWHDKRLTNYPRIVTVYINCGSRKLKYVVCVNIRPTQLFETNSQRMSEPKQDRAEASRRWIPTDTVSKRAFSPLKKALRLA
jgi:hypothetical protein